MMNEYQRDQEFGIDEVCREDRDLLLGLLNSINYQIEEESSSGKNVVRSLSLGGLAVLTFPLIPKVRAIGEIPTDDEDVLHYIYSIVDARQSFYRLKIGMRMMNTGAKPESYILELLDANHKFMKAIMFIDAKDGEYGDDGYIPHITTYGVDPEKIALEFLDSWNAQKVHWGHEEY